MRERKVTCDEVSLVRVDRDEAQCTKARRVKGDETDAQGRCARMVSPSLLLAF